MTQSIDSNFLPLSFYEKGGSTQPGLFQRVKSALWGRITNWEDSLIVAAVVYYVVKAAASFFTGYWILSLVEVLTAGFLAVVRRRLRDSLTLEKGYNILEKQNIDLKKNNYDFRKGLVTFNEELKDFSRQKEQNAAQIKRLELDLTTFEGQMGSMKQGYEQAIKEIDYAASRGKQVSSQILKDHLKNFEAQKELIDKAKGELIEQRDETHVLWKQIVASANKMNAQQVEEVQRLATQVGELEGRIETLREVEKDLQTRIQQLKQTGQKIDQSADRNERISQHLAATSKLEFGDETIRFDVLRKESLPHWVLGLGALGTLAMVGKYLFGEKISV